jgi:hypothetical protein
LEVSPGFNPDLAWLFKQSEQMLKKSLIVYEEMPIAPIFWIK